MVSAEKKQVINRLAEHGFMERIRTALTEAEYLQVQKIWEDDGHISWIEAFVVWFQKL